MLLALIFEKITLLETRILIFETRKFFISRRSYIPLKEELGVKICPKIVLPLNLFSNLKIFP